MYSVLVVILVGVIIKLIQKVAVGRDDSNVCLVGKTAIITGGNSGIGYRTALKLASRGCRIIIADVADSQKSVKQIVEITGNKNVVYKFIDLSSFESTRKFAQEILKEEHRLDILLNNAGVAGFEGVYTTDGILKHLQVNYVGPFLLTHLLVDLLKKTQQSRIIFVASILAFIHTNFALADLNKEPTLPSNLKFLQSVVNYNNNKLCLIAATSKLANKLKKYGITCASLHPGLVSTPIIANTKANITVRTFMVHIGATMTDLFLFVYGKTADEGAETSVYCATSPNIVTGEFYADCNIQYKPKRAKDQMFIDDLWKESERLAKLEAEEKLTDRTTQK